ncbi:MAG: DUF6266 family protein [Balneolales bacterium]
MAKYKKGILGSFSGTIGNVVGATWRGIAYMRSKPSRVNNPNTEAQQIQRQKFSLVAEFLRLLKPIIKLGFKTGYQHLTEINRASSYNLKNAITGVFPDQELDYQSVLLSRGDLTPSLDPAAAAGAPGEVSITWSENTGVGSAKADDKVMVAIYNPAKNSAFYTTDAAVRSDGYYDAVLPLEYVGDTVECYIALVSADGKEASNSEYLGSVTVA